MYSNLSFTDREDIQQVAWEALQKQRRNKTKAEERLQLAEEREATMDYSVSIFEEYHIDDWKTKIKKDTNIYNILLEEINDSPEVIEKIQFILSDLLKTTNSIYEHINVKPDTFGFANLTTDSSEVELRKEAVEIVNKYLSKNYYSMSNYDRKKLYQERVCNLCKDIVINEDAPVSEALLHSYKSVVVENLLEVINFPKPVYYRVQELMTNSAYGEVFEQEKLVDLWNDFKTKNSTLSRIFAKLV